MKKDILKNIIIIVLCVIVVFMALKNKNKFVYINDEKEHICRKCIIINKTHYCETYGIDKESDK